jgi:hypothetical protein
LQVKLQATKGNRDGIGALVGVLRAGGPALWRRVHTDGSYLASGDLRVAFGLGEKAEVQGVVVEWPDGSKEKWGKVEVDRVVVLRQGTGSQGAGIR